MPLMKEPPLAYTQKEELQGTKSKTVPTRTQSSTATTVQIRMNIEQWPSLGDSSPSVISELNDWEYISEPNEADETKINKVSNLDCSSTGSMSIIHRCESTPEFSSYSTLGSDDDYSLINGSNSSVVAESIATTKDDTVLLSHKPKRVPSFKDMILLNAEKIKEEESKKKEQMEQLVEEKRRDAIQRKKQIKTRLIVTPIKRCARSTGDLRSLTIHEGEEGYSADRYDGLMSPGSNIIYEDEEILGYSDAQEYYDRKSHGSSGRAKGQRIRPDEAKRKEMIIHKKNAQRRAQGVKTKNKK